MDIAGQIALRLLLFHAHFLQQEREVHEMPPSNDATLSDPRITR